MNMYLELLKAKEGDKQALERIIKSYEIFANLQMNKLGVQDTEECYAEILEKICYCIKKYKIIKTEEGIKIA